MTQDSADEPVIDPDQRIDITDWGGLYRTHAVAIAALVRDLPPEQVELTVPATPGWTVREVLAHLVGGAADTLVNRTGGAPGPAWTAQHVGERAGASVADLLTELNGQLDATVTWIERNQPGATWDISVHHADLHEALGRGRVPDHFWAPVLDHVGPYRIPAGVDVGDVAAYELFRAVFSRRSTAQMRAWGLPLTDEQLDAIPVFGPRGDDQPIPGPHA